MYKFGLAYYMVVDGKRVPHTGVDVRLVSPGDGFEDGIMMPESGVAAGYYEADLDVEDAGYYEIWDDVSNPAGAFSGKTTTIGPIGSRGIQSLSIAGQQIMDGVITADKIADGAVTTEKLNSSVVLGVTNMKIEVQTQAKGVGSPSSSTPPEKSDVSVTHVFDELYDAVPLVFVTEYCNARLWVENVDVTEDVLKVTLGIDNPDEIDPPLYQIIVMR